MLCQGLLLLNAAQVWIISCTGGVPESIQETSSPLADLSEQIQGLKESNVSLLSLIVCTFSNSLALSEESSSFLKTRVLPCQLYSANIIQTSVLFLKIEK